MVIKIVISNTDKEMINILLRSVYSLNFKIQTEITIYDRNDKGFRHAAENMDTDILVIDCDCDGETEYGFQHISSRVKLFRDRTLIVYTASVLDQNIIKQLLYSEPFTIIQKNELEASIQKKMSNAITRIALLHKSQCRYKYKKNGQIKSIPLEEIMYLCSDNRKIICVMNNGSTDCFYGKLDDTERTIAAQTVLFSRVSKSFLVNNRYINGVNGDYIIMSNGEEIKVTKNHFASLL